MEVFLLTVECVLFVCLGICVYALFRNNNVFMFRQYIDDKMFNYLIMYIQRYGVTEKYAEINKMCMTIIEKHSYKKMFFSILPLKTRYWYTEKEIAFIKHAVNELKNNY